MTAAQAEAAPTDFRGLMERGQESRAAGDHRAALGLFQAALAQRPREAWSRMAVADALRDLGRADEADEACRALLADEPENAAALMALGHSLRRRGDAAAALPLFRAALARKPREAWARMAVADTLRDLGRLDEAEEAWRALLADEPGQLPALMSLGHAAAAKADRHAAASWFERAVRAAPDAPGPRLALADALRNTGGFGEAAEAAEAVLARDPSHAGAWASLGHTERRAGRRAAALQAFARASELRPTDPKPLVEMAVEERALGRPEASEALLRRALEADAADSDALQQLGEHLRLANRLDAALEMFRRAMASPRPPIWAHLAASQILADLGDADAALRTLEEAGARLGARPEFAAKRVELLRRTGDLSGARDVVAEAARTWPGHFGLWFERARLEQTQGGPEALLACLDDAPAGTTHERARVHHLRGLAAADRWRFEEAAGHYARAIELNPDDGWPRICLAQTRLLALDTEGAREELRAVARLEASACKLQGRSTNISQTHLGQLLDEFALDRQALEELRALRGVAPAERVPPLLDVVRRYPDYTPAAIALLIALRRSGRLARGPEVRPCQPGAARIPDTVAQYWDDDELPPDVGGIMASWSRLYPRFALRRFSDAQARAFLARSHPAEVQAAYRRSRQPAQKADIFRLAYLYSEGGWYADTDDRLIGDFDALRSPGAGLVLYQEDVGTVGNNVLGAAPGHPVIGRALRLAVEAINRGDGDLLWLSTGPGLLTRAFADLIARADRPPLAALDDAVVLEFWALQRVVSIHCLLGYKATERHWSRSAFAGKRLVTALSGGAEGSPTAAGKSPHSGRAAE
jgi:tetratricopeptide (TPR) repeat protein